MTNPVKVRGTETVERSVQVRVAGDMIDGDRGSDDDASRVEDSRNRVHDRRVPGRGHIAWQPHPKLTQFVPKPKIDKRYASSMGGDQVVQLAPGVYAEAVPGGELGTLDDYSGLTGNCAAIKRYTEAHPKAGGSTCW
ncbi:hypothetical protein [Amycolatopsis eburnea]|uniref:Uncharacterized protein n=1 Tax=Amycolatopsis eburnea TaxID=2267691 RepID=A0A427SZ75_9PSEU|nr:hypothetical protein [Amycolatopsis eburnea]RSD10266.1 hypothetical protein EIY87_35865 [Amycolatopsis eburnea]